ncbi:MAG: hypothetical protein AAFV49_11925, partial [Pseudomonadota bacterium]
MKGRITRKATSSYESPFISAISRASKTGLARDGGLYVPEAFPVFEAREIAE